jgi:CTP synthase (UTP-ammonia lyase)
LKVGIVGDFSPEYPSQISTNNALLHSARKLGLSVEYEWIPTATISKLMDTIKETYQGFWIGPGFPDSMEGVLSIVQFARENNVPLLGTCGGFQYIIMEYVRNKMMLENAGHEERDPHSNQLIISKLACSLVGQKGEVIVKKSSRIFEIYQVENVIEQFRCNYGLSPEYEKQIHEAGLRIVGTDSKGNPRIIELPEHKFFIGTLFVPQLSSTSDSTHCIVDEFITIVFNNR